MLQANSRKRKPRGKKNKTVKPKMDEMVNSLSSAPPSEKSSEDEDYKEDEKVCIVDWLLLCLFSFDCFLKTGFTCLFLEGLSFACFFFFIIIIVGFFYDLYPRD